MTTLAPYLTFMGNCEEALTFYKDALRGDVREMHRYETMPDVPAGFENKILHAHFVAEGISFMCSDNMPEQGEVTQGNGITLMLNCDDEAEQTRIFDALAQGGQVTYALADTFWDARFGSLIDKYGFSWSLNCDKK